MASPEPEIYRLFINGQWKHSLSRRTVPNRNPANVDDVIGHTPLATLAEADEAIEAASSAFRAWRRKPAPQRGAIIARAAQIMTSRKEELSRALTREEGKILREARGEVQRAINVLEFTAGESRRFCGDVIPTELEDNLCYTVRQPLGVVALITPWNFPVAIPVWKIAPALVAGNTVVFKPATLTPMTAGLVVEIFKEAGLPAGCLNMVLGTGGEVGERLVDHPKIRAISFTGSNEIGSRLYARGAQRMIRVQCEMGGKNPVVVLEDADLDLAAAATIQGAFGSTGQRCTATSRVVVTEEVADRFVEKLVDCTGRLKIGNGLDETIDVGPSVDETQMNTVLRYIETGKREGAALLCGGERLRNGILENGFFVSPTIFDHVARNSRIAQEEIFGPVLAIQRARNFEEALDVANDVRFGLSSSLFSNDASRIFRFIEGIETGITHINSGNDWGRGPGPVWRNEGYGNRAAGTGQRVP